jgi:wobble nucleotide-excising tRNase
MVDPNVIAGIAGSAVTAIVGAIVYFLRSSADARNKINVDTATARNIQQTTAQDAVANTLAAVVLLLKEAIENLGKANDTASKERAEAALLQREIAGHLSGMMAMLSKSNDKTQGMSLSLNDMERELSEARTDIKGITKTTDSLKTDIEGTLTTQFAPVVLAVKGVTDQLEKLSSTLQNNDAETVKRFAELKVGFGALETTLLRALEPLLIKQLIGDTNGTQTPDP